MVKAIRTVSRNGQIAIPKRFLEALGLTPPVKVQIIQERSTVSIRPQPAAAPLANFDELRRHFARVGVTSGDVRRAVAWARRRAGR